MAKGILGKKLGMTQVFVGGEDLIPVTVVQAGPCTVVQKKTKDVDGYDAIQVGFGDVKPHRVTRPLLGHYKRSGAAPTRFLREFQVENIDEYEVGQIITADIFKPGDRVDVVGISKGKGFQGGMKRHGFAVTVLDKAAIVREKMGALLSIAQGSAEEPRFIVLEYKGSDAAPVVLVGKGVTFDTGGISIKPAQNMEDMKFDMSGAAAVLGTFEMLGRLKPRVHVVGLIPSTENMPSGTAVKPGDVITSHFGNTIEMINTDAEGRLILSDGLAYACRYKPAVIVDVATLTGACLVALGRVPSGLLGNDDALCNDLLAASETANDSLWRLPLWEEYQEQLKSNFADLANVGGKDAGTITAACFLSQFAENYHWAHLDIAGIADVKKGFSNYPAGGTGYGVRLLAELAIDLCK